MRTLKQSLVIGMAIMLGSCTVEKRLHNAGYHVKYLGHENVSAKNEIQKTDVKEADLTSANQVTENEMISYKSDVQANMRPVDVQQPVVKETFLTRKKNQVDLYVKGLSFETKSVAGKVGQTFEESTTKKESKQFTESAPSKVTRGLLIMLAALLLIGIGYIFFLYLGVLGSVLFFIFGLGGVVFFIAGLFIMIFGK